MDIEKYFVIRNVQTHNETGFKEKEGSTIFVPLGGEIEDFIKQYNVLKNYEMGITIELYDKKTKMVDHFSIIFAFISHDTTQKGYFTYSVLEERIDNLEVLEILDKHKEINSKNISKQYQF